MCAASAPSIGFSSCKFEFPVGQTPDAIISVSSDGSGNVSPVIGMQNLFLYRNPFLSGRCW